jgi:uncharacterized SAM-binding protein YcdF (DUF218 family)
MSALVSYLFSVTGLTLTLIVIAAVSVSRLPRGRTRRTIAAAAFAYWLATTYVVPYSVSRLLMWGYRPFEPSDVGPGSTAIVLLGGGDSYVKGWVDDITVTMPVEAARMLEARRVFRLLPASWIISSGGPPTAPVRSRPSSTVMRDELLRLGVPAERILLESTSLDTHDEAVLIEPLLKPLGIRNVVIVTSDLHMRRSLGAFRAVGLDVRPAIAPDSRRPIYWWEWLLPTDRGLDLTSDIAHEVIGIPYYWLRGWWRS